MKNLFFNLVSKIALSDQNPKILFLGYNNKQTKIIDALIRENCVVTHSEDPIDLTGYDFIICFGYRHIISKKTIGTIKSPIINLHISYLPFNKGAHPNFWSFYDNTPPGVTIHLIDEGLDTGPIIYQKKVNFKKSEIRFTETYKRLINEIESLFIEHIGDILNENWSATPQKGNGSKHYSKDLPKKFLGWNSIIKEEIERLKTLEKNE